MIGNGTFSDFLEAREIKPPARLKVTLADCFARIPELARAFASQSRPNPLVIPVKAEAKLSGRVILDFDDNFANETEFRKGWEKDFPSLAPICELSVSGCTLELKQPLPSRNHDAVCDFCEEHLLPGLESIEERSWFAVRIVDPKLVLPRDAYYYVAMFILSSIARYEPEQLQEVARFESELGWLLRKFFNLADRYYPQLLLSWVYGKTLYHGIG